jgi:hypothetical protein
LEDDLAAAELDLGGDAIARLDAASAPPVPYPYRFLEAYAGREL